jgi:hypothetical protein
LSTTRGCHRRRQRRPVDPHGYDLSADVAPGRPAVIDFTADAPGVFEVELEQAHLRLFELQVQ